MPEQQESFWLDNKLEPSHLGTSGLLPATTSSPEELTKEDENTGLHLLSGKVNILLHYIPYSKLITTLGMNYSPGTTVGARRLTFNLALDNSSQCFLRPCGLFNSTRSATIRLHFILYLFK